MRTTPCESHGEQSAPRAGGARASALRARSGQGLCFWYQATRMAVASNSCRYRLGHVAEALRGATTLVDRAPPQSQLRGMHALVVVRPWVDEACRSVLSACRSQGVRLVADFDDLLFAGDPARYPLVLNGRLSERACAERIQRYSEGLECFDAFTVSTEPLRAQLLAVRPQADVAVVPNGLSPHWVAQGRRLYDLWQPGDPKVIRFFCGSPSHDADFANVVHALGHFLRAHPDVSLEVVGQELSSPHLPSARVRHLPVVPYLELPRLLSSTWVTIAPLASTAFNDCKSAIKFLEAAAFGVPCIASPTRDMARCPGALLARDDAAWLAALDRLLDDSERMRVGEDARRWVDSFGHAGESARQLVDWMAS